ncbi:uncharacterized protein LOC143235534 [Tachypleus tridentatus]|uniref:uncharacterized protein LOC143235534 n=1 Tax=Tachypleus tridentatus TaxID=6853 RepID=UPI003FD44CE2
MILLYVQILMLTAVPSCLLVKGQGQLGITRNLSLTNRGLSNPKIKVFGNPSSSPGKFDLGVGIGSRLWQSKNNRFNVGAGASLQQGVKPFGGQLFPGKPSVGLGTGLNIKLGPRNKVISVLILVPQKGLEEDPSILVLASNIDLDVR